MEIRENNMNKNVLIIGFGKMGKLYSKYLFGFKIGWNYYDPYISGGIEKLSNLNQYTHILISTQPEYHYECYKKIRDLKFNGYIYIDKPVVIDKNDFNIFNDEKVFCGMTERYNPVIQKLRELINIEKLISIKFTRFSLLPNTVKVPVLYDLGIHDLDLYVYLLDLDIGEIPKQFNKYNVSKTQYITIKYKDIISIFEWSHESKKRERKILILQEDIFIEVDLIDQTIITYEQNSVVKNIYVDKSQPIKETMINFLNNKKCCASISHNIMKKIDPEI